jgi:hypothetical protein
VGLAAVALPAPAPADTERWVRDHVHGFVSQGFLTSTRNNYLNDSRRGDFEFTEAAVNVFGQIRPNLSVGGQLFTRDLGPLGNYRVDIDWAFLDWGMRDELGLRLGAFKLPYGLYNETADVDAVRTPILLPQSIYNLQFRDFQVSSTGTAAYGSLAVPAGQLNYETHFGWTFIERDESVARTLEDFGGGAWAVQDIDPIPGAGLAVIWDIPTTDVRAGFTFQRYLSGRLPFRLAPFAQAPGGPATSAWTFDAFDMHVASLEYTPGLWTFVAEYGQWNGELANPQFPIPVADERYYAQVARALLPELEVSGYYSVYYPERDDRDGDTFPVRHRAYQKDAALSLRFDLTERWIAKIEGHDVRGTASLAQSENPDGLQRRWRCLATKLSVAF